MRSARHSVRAAPCPRPSPHRRTAAARRPGRRSRRPPPTPRSHRLDPAADGDARHAGGRRSPGDAERGLAEPGLRVDPALAGDDEVGAREPAHRTRSRPSPTRRRAAARTKRTAPGSPAARTRRRRPRQHQACPAPASRRAPPARRPKLRVARVEQRRPASASRPSAVRRPRPHRSGPSSGFETSQATSRSTRQSLEATGAIALRGEERSSSAGPRPPSRRRAAADPEGDRGGHRGRSPLAISSPVPTRRGGHRVPFLGGQPR